MKRIISLMGLALCTFIILTGCSNKQELTAEQIDEINAAFETLLPAGAGDIAVILGPDKKFTLNPISHFFTSYYETPEQMEMGAFVYYIPRKTFLSSNNDEVEIASLQEKYEHLSIDSLLATVPFGRIPFATVNQYLQTYMNLTLEDMTNMGTAVYLENYEAFYSSASDFGPGAFYCTSGEIRGDVITLYSDHAALTLKQDGEHYFIISHIAND